MKDEVKDEIKATCPDCKKIVDAEIYSNNEGCNPLYTCVKCGQFCEENNP